MPGAGWLLAVESAADVAGGALLRGTQGVAVRRAPPVRPASETLLPLLLALLAEHGIAPAEVDAFAVSIGPGSFTGLRVGVATVKGLAFGAGTRVAAVPTLAAVAAGAAEPVAGGVVVGLLDARRGEVYAAAHAAADPLAPPLFGPMVLGAEALAARLEALGPGCTVAGPGVPVVRAALRERFGARVRLVEPAGVGVDPAVVGRLGARLLASGAGIAPEALVPLYVRRAEAEVRRAATGADARARPGPSTAATGPGPDFDTSRDLS